MSNTENSRGRDEIALERFKLISPILSAFENKYDNAKIGLIKSEVCALAGISRKTLTRWLNRYADKGFNGLKFQASPETPRRLIPGELVKEAILLKLEVPTRSVTQIIEILEMEGKVSAGFLKRSTLQDRLREEGYSTAQMKMYQAPALAARRFERSNRNDLWQADIKYGPFLQIKGQRKQVYFVGFIDDATRYIIHGEFYDTLDQRIVEDCLRKAIGKEGVPQRLFFDNGKQFRNKFMQRACAILNIKLIFAAPYSPESKGKIERFNRTLDSFFAEAALKNSKSLSEFNKLFNVWLSECYHKREHDGIGKAPIEAYLSSKTPLRFLEQETITRAFLHAEKRKVDRRLLLSKKYWTTISCLINPVA